MIPAIRLVKVSSQRAESVINRRYFCRKLIEARSVSGPNRSFRQIPVFSPAQLRHTLASLCEGFSARLSAESGRAVPGSGFGGGKLGWQAVAPGHGITPSSTSGSSPKERYRASAQRSGRTGRGSGWPNRRRKAG